jgi:hypothetical protein
VPRLGIELDGHPTHTREGRIDVFDAQEQPNAVSRLITNRARLPLTVDLSE